MSLTTVSLPEIVKKQYRYKLKSYSQVFMSLMFVQIIAIFFSFGGVGMMGSGSSGFEVQIHYYSADIVVVFTLLWGFLSSILITTKAYQLDDFAFISNRVTSFLSNLLFLLTASVIGSITAALSAYVIKDVLYIKGVSFLGITHVMAAPVEFLLGLFTTTLYVFLFSSVGYLIGTLVQVHRGFAVLLPVLAIGSLFLAAALKMETLLTFIYQFLFSEASLLFFILKAVILTIVFFGSALLLANRSEVNT